jgi:hypothetical protein
MTMIPPDPPRLPKGTQVDNAQDANGICRARLATGFGSAVDADKTSRDWQGHTESTRDPIFMVQKRKIVGLDFVNALNTEDYYHDGDTLWFTAERFDKEEILEAAKDDRVLLKKDDDDLPFDMGISISEADQIERDWALVVWDVVTVMRTRQEAEAYAVSQAHNIGKLGESCRVYCLPCAGELATILKHVDRRSVAEFVETDEFKRSLALWEDAQRLAAGPQPGGPA